MYELQLNKFLEQKFVTSLITFEILITVDDFMKVLLNKDLFCVYYTNNIDSICTLKILMQFFKYNTKRYILRKINEQQLKQQLEKTKDWINIVLNQYSDELQQIEQQIFYLSNKLSISLDIILSQNINVVMDETLFVQLCYNFDRVTLHQIEHQLQKQAQQYQEQQQISQRQSQLSFEETIRSSLAGTPNIFEEQFKQYSTMQASGLSNLISQDQMDYEEQQENETEKLNVNASLSKFFYSQTTSVINDLQTTNKHQQNSNVDPFTFPYNIEVSDNLQHLCDQIQQYKNDERFAKVIQRYYQQQSDNMPISSRLSMTILDLIETAPENIKIQIAWSGSIGVSSTKNQSWIQYYYQYIQKYLKKQLIRYENRLSFPLNSILSLQTSLGLSGVQYTATKQKDSQYRVSLLLTKYGIAQEFKNKSWGELTQRDQKILLNQANKIKGQQSYQIITQQIVLYTENSSISSNDVVEIMNIYPEIGLVQYSKNLDVIRNKLQEYIEYKIETLQWFERNDCQLKKGSIVFSLTSDLINKLDYQLLIESALLLNVKYWHKNLKSSMLDQYMKTGKLEKLGRNKIDNTPVVKQYLQLQFQKPKRTFEEIKLHFALVFVKRDEAKIEYNQYEQGIIGCVLNQDLPLIELEQGNLGVFNQIIEQQ